MLTIKKLKQKDISLAKQYIAENSRLLEKRLFDYHFKDSNTQSVLFALKLYQNKDGGFGQGIEPDFRLPDSSPMATSIGLRILDELKEIEQVKEMKKKAAIYLESTYNKKRTGWYSVSDIVNEYPHTPWWNFDQKEKRTVIDKNWGNPTAELIAYLYKNRKYLKKLDIDYLVDYAVSYINDKNKFNSKNEVFCFIKLYNSLSEREQEKIKDSLSEAVAQVIEYDENKWQDYVGLPLHFVKRPKNYKFKIKEEKIQANLDLYLKLIKENTVIKPPWEKDFYKDGLKIAYEEWKGVLTLDTLKVLNNFNRVER
ncbi:MAG: hypothetical protein K9K32_01820 [Halanaerobiales bacterium]|nr:hypothetical protein [Halanaerobiales bacterium]